MRLKPTRRDTPKSQDIKPKTREPKLVKYPSMNLDRYLPEIDSDKAQVAVNIYNNFPEKVYYCDSSFEEWITSSLKKEELYLSPEYLSYIKTNIVSARMDVLTHSNKNGIKNFSFPRELFGKPDEKRAWYLKKSWIMSFESAICSEKEYSDVGSNMLKRLAYLKDNNKNQNKKTGKRSFRLPKKKTQSNTLTP